MNKELIIGALCEQHEREKENGNDELAIEVDEEIAGIEDVIITMDMDTSRLIAMRLEELMEVTDGLEASQISIVVNKIRDQLDY